MTDEIRITRRVALPDKYEYYEIQWKSNDTPFGNMLKTMETYVEEIRNYCGKPSPEISPRTETHVQPDTGTRETTPAIEHELKDHLDLLNFGDGWIQQRDFLDKETWKEINAILRKLNYKWQSKEKGMGRWELK